MTNVMDRCCCSGAAIAAERATEAADAAKLTAKGVRQAYDVAAEALKTAQGAAKILDLKTEAHELGTGEPPCVRYDADENLLDFGIPRGEAGPKGEPPLIRGAIEDVSSLPGTGVAGDCWLVRGMLYVWDMENSTWNNVGSLRGEKGDRGDALTIHGSAGSMEDLPENGDDGGWLVQGDLYLWNETRAQWENNGRIQGENGHTPTIGANENWWINGVDTGVRAVQGRGIRDDEISGPAGSSTATLPSGVDNALALVPELGLFRFVTDSHQLVDGETCLAASDGVGRWELVLPSVDLVLALSCQNTTPAVDQKTEAEPELVEKSVTVTSGSIAAYSSVVLNVDPGENVKYFVSASPPANLADKIAFTAYLEGGVLKLRLTNVSASSVTPAAAAWTFTFLKGSILS